MTDLVSDSTGAQSPKRKFSFRFPHLAHHQSVDKDATTSMAQNHHPKGAHGAHRARNFTDEIRNLPDLQVFFLVLFLVDIFQNICILDVNRLFELFDVFVRFFWYFGGF